MVIFDRNSCEKCCANFGAFIKIERQLSSRDYYCKNCMNNELFLAHIEGGFAEGPPLVPLGERTNKKLSLQPEKFRG
ncbi:MAG: hypothetical protein WCF90_05625 [Methanomicrobiales archaeon]